MLDDVAGQVAGMRQPPPGVRQRFRVPEVFDAQGREVGRVRHERRIRFERRFLRDREEQRSIFGSARAQRESSLTRVPAGGAIVRAPAKASPRSAGTAGQTAGRCAPPPDGPGPCPRCRRCTRIRREGPQTRGGLFPRAVPRQAPPARRFAAAGWIPIWRYRANEGRSYVLPALFRWVRSFPTVTVSARKHMRIDGFRMPSTDSQRKELEGTGLPE